MAQVLMAISHDFANMCKFSTPVRKVYYPVHTVKPEDDEPTERVDREPPVLPPPKNVPTSTGATLLGGLDIPIGSASKPV